MLDIRFIRENPDKVRQAVSDRNDTAPVDEILSTDSLRRQRVGQLDSLRQARNVLSHPKNQIQSLQMLFGDFDALSSLVGSNDNLSDEQRKEVARALRVEIQALEDEVRTLDARLTDLLPGSRL